MGSWLWFVPCGVRWTTSSPLSQCHKEICLLWLLLVPQVYQFVSRDVRLQESPGITLCRSTMPERHKAHLSHCLDILLQALTCSPSLDLVPHVWMKTQQHPYPDFNIKRQCVAHSPLLEWQKGVGIPNIFEKWPNFPRPSGLKEVEAEASLLQIGEDLGS